MLSQQHKKNKHKYVLFMDYFYVKLEKRINYRKRKKSFRRSEFRIIYELDTFIFV